MRLISSLILFIVLISSAFAGARVESHSDHEEDQIHSQDITYHAHNHVDQKTPKKDNKKDTCPHFHIHCSTACCAIFESSYKQFPNMGSVTSKLFYNLEILHPQDYSISLYRPPIA